MEEKVSGGIITFQVGASSGLVGVSGFFTGAMGWLSLALSGTLNSTAVCAVLAGGESDVGLTVVADVAVIGAPGGGGYGRREFGAAAAAEELPDAPGTGG